MSLKKIKTLKELEEHTKNLVMIGEGVGREVFAINDDSVLKVAIDEDGINQNVNEWYVFKACTEAPVPRILDTSIKSMKHLYWLVVERVTPVVGDKLDEAVSSEIKECDTFDDLQAIINAGLYNDSDARDERFHKHLMKTNTWYKHLFETIVKCDLNTTELHGGNWGVTRNRRLVLLDTGI